MRCSITALAVLTSSACAGNLYEVHRGTQKVNGIPFYIQASSCAQETVYLETIYQIAVQVPPNEGTIAIVLMEKSIPASVYSSAAMQQLREAVTARSPSINTISERLNALKVYETGATPEVILVSNITKSESYVDYSSVHYVNVSRPGIGSASATAKLNANGTLAESTAAVEDKTAETVLATLPIKEAVLGVLSRAGLPSILGDVDNKTPLAVQLIVTPARFKHILSKTEAGSAPCPAKTKLEIGDTSANTRREVVSDSSGKDDKDENAIGVAGKVGLPKQGGGV